MSPRTVDNPKIVSREEWLAAHKQLLAREKQLTRERDAVAAVDESRIIAPVGSAVGTLPRNGFQRAQNRKSSPAT